MVAAVAGVVVGCKGEAGQPEHEPGDELFVIATGAFDFEIPVEPTSEVLKPWPRPSGAGHRFRCAEFPVRRHSQGNRQKSAGDGLQ